MFASFLSSRASQDNRAPRSRVEAQEDRPSGREGSAGRLGSLLLLLGRVLPSHRKQAPGAALQGGQGPSDQEATGVD